MESTEGQEDVAKEGYMTRMKTKKQKYFVLKHGFSNIDDTGVPIPHLDYYISQEKYHSNPFKPRRSILLPDCIGISIDPHPFLHPSPPSKHFDLLKLSRPGMISSKKGKHQITLKEWTQTFKENLIHIYTTKDVFVVSLDGETERDEWFDKLIQLRNVWLKSLNLQKHFKRNWRIKMLNRSTNYEVIYKPGYYYVFMGEVSVVLLLDEEGKEVRYDFPLDSIMRFGDRQELFFIETGYSCPTGLGELWFSAEDSVIASNIHHHFLYLLKFHTRKKSLIESMKKEPLKRQDDTLNQLMNEKAPENKSPIDVTDASLNSLKENETICSKDNQISIPSPTIVAETSNDKLKNCQKSPPLHNHKTSLHHPFDNFEVTESSSDSSSLSGFNRAQYFDHYVQMRTSSVGTKQDCLNRVVDDKSISAPHLPHHEEGFVLRKNTPSAYMDMSGNKQPTTSASLFFSTPAPLKPERPKEEIYVHIDYPKQPKSGVTQYILGTLKSIPHRVLRSHPSKLIKKDDEEDIEESINRPRLSTIPSERHRLSFLSRISRPRAFTFGQARAKEPSLADSVPIETTIELLLQQYEQERQKSIKQCMEGYERMDLGPIPLAGVELMTRDEPYPYVPMDFIPPSTKVAISCTCVKTTVNSTCVSCVSGSSSEKPSSHYIDMNVNLPQTTSDAIQITQKIKTSTSPLMSTIKYTPNTTATFTETSLTLFSHLSSPHYLDMNSNLDSINNNDNNDNNSNHSPISSIPYLLKNHVDKKTDANQKNDQINLCTNREKTFNTH